jgi:hypothetical protein
MKIKWLLSVIALMFFINVPDVNAQTEKKLMSSALSNVNALSPDLSTKERLQIYEKVLNNINQIIEEHGDTDLGLTLKSTGKFGEVNFKALELQYQQETTTYYKKVCEVSPSAICQGFTALSNGSGVCKTGGTFPDLVAAHDSILNALVIFKEQEKNQNLYKMARTIYLQCSISPQNMDAKVSNDYFNFQLIKTLIKLKENNSVKGLIEQLSDPFYKFSSIALLKEFSGEPINDEYIDRLRKYIDEKLDAERNMIAQMALLNLAISERSTASKNKVLVFYSINKPAISVCNASLARETVDQAFLLMQKMDQEQIGDNVRKLFYTNFANGINRLYWIDLCGENNSMTLSGSAYLFLSKRTKEAKKYFREVSTGHYSSDKVRLIYQYLDYASDDKLAPLPPVMLLAGIDMHYAVFKKLVDIENICDASKLMFKELEKSKYRNAAVKYLSDQRSLSKKTYRCGDEDLELLLK